MYDTISLCRLLQSFLVFKQFSPVFCIHSVKQQFTLSYRYCLMHMVRSLFIWLKKIKVENHLINMSTKFKWRKYFLIRRDIMSLSPVIRSSDMSLPLADLCVSLVLPAAIVSCADSNESRHVLLIILTWNFVLDRHCT